MWSFIKSLWNGLTALKSFVTTLLFLLILVAVVSLLWRGAAGPAAPIVHDGSALRLALNGVIVEQLSEPTLAAVVGQQEGMAQEILLSDVIDALSRAASDDRIKAVALELDGFFGAGPANLATIGEALDKVRAAGKPVVAYATAYVEPSYFLAAHASEVMVNPRGGVLLQGFGSYQLYLKDGLDRLKVDVNLFKAGRYKAFAEPYTRTDMSVEARESTRALLDALWANYTTTVNTKRKAKKVDVARYVETLPEAMAAQRGDAAKVALQAGLVDRIADEVGFRTRMAELVGDGEDFDGLPSYNQTEFASYMAATRPTLDIGQDAVAVVYAVGELLDGEHPPGVAGGDTIARLVRQAANDDAVKAIVLRVDSPGGSVTASEKIRAELARAQSLGKPVVASMGTLAASGGYWISATSDVIFAQPSTITGSIGVFGILPTVDRALGAYGVRSDGVGTTSLSDAGDLTRPMSEPVKMMIQSSVENTYDSFLALVAKGRKISVEQADAAGQGRPWDGGTARQLKLVDRFGDLEEAVAEAAKRAGLSSWRTQVIAQPESLDMLLLRKLTDVIGIRSSQPSAEHQLLTRLASLASPLAASPQDIMSGRGQFALCLECRPLARVGLASPWKPAY
jgi:protease IV